MSILVHEQRETYFIALHVGLRCRTVLRDAFFFLFFFLSFSFLFFFFFSFSFSFFFFFFFFFFLFSFFFLRFWPRLMVQDHYNLEEYSFSQICSRTKFENEMHTASGVYGKHAPGAVCIQIMPLEHIWLGALSHIWTLIIINKTRDISTHWVLKAPLCDSRSAHIGNQTSGRQAGFLYTHNERPETIDQKYERIPIFRCRRKPEYTPDMADYVWSRTIRILEHILT